jgi:hypothetical protein
MDKTIVLDCQAKLASFNCEDCIAFKECSLSKKTGRTPTEAWETDMEVFLNV